MLRVLALGILSVLVGRGILLRSRHSPAYFWGRFEMGTNSTATAGLSTRSTIEIHANPPVTFPEDTSL